MGRVAATGASKPRPVAGAIRPVKDHCAPGRCRLRSSLSLPTNSTPLLLSNFQYHLCSVKQSARSRPSCSCDPGEPRKLASRSPSITNLFDVGPTSHRRQRAQSLQRLHRDTEPHNGAERGHQRSNVFSVAAEAMGDERRRNQCLGWLVLAVRPSNKHS